jgi:transposase
MTQASNSLSHPIALDHDSTLVLAIELSNTKWVVAAQVPGLPRVKAKQTIEPTAEALLAAIDGYRHRARAAGRTGGRNLRGQLVGVLVGALVTPAGC